MPLISKPNYNQIFASQAPEQDKPAVFNNYPGGWGVESRPNNGKPTIKGFNHLQQISDLKDLWILQNGACLPYDESIEYAEGAPVLKDGVIQYKTASGFKSRDAVSIPTYNNAADGVAPVTGVADGAYFNVRSTDDESYIDEYQNVGGSAVASGKSYPSGNAKWPASSIYDASGATQQEINTFLKKRVAKSKADLAGTMIASDGDIVLLTSLNLDEYSGGGEFVYDETLANVNDGYMIINGFKRNFGNGFLQIEWFGGRPFTDCTAAYKRAVAFLKANPVRPASYSRGGYFGIQFNAGVYLISENIKFDNMAGFTVKGSGVQATTIVYTTNSGTFYDYVGYSNIHFSDMTVQCGTYDPVTQYVTNPSTRNAVCSDFDGTNGGTKYTEDNIRYVGWNRVYKTTKTTINCDMHSYNRISYEENNVVWENSNVNAVSWEFNQCYTHSIREAVLLNPCNTTRFVGGDHINPAPFFKLNVGGHGSSCTFSELRFEFWYDRNGVIGEFKYLDVTRLCQGTVFENCSTFAVGSNPSTRQTGYVSGNFDIKFKNCKLYGYWEALGDVYNRAAKSMLTFEDCLTVPVINHIYGTEVVKSPIGVNYIRQNTQEGGAITGTTVNRFYRGAVLNVGSHLAISKEPMIDTFQVREYVNGTFTHTFPVWNVAPFVLQLSKIRLAIHKDNATNPLDVKFYSDAAKTQLIATHSITAPISTANRIYTIVDVLPSSFTNTPIFSGAATNIYMELSAPSAAAGTCYVNVEFEYMHVGFST